MRSYYEYHHFVELEETDHAGNVFDVNYVRWQGRCQEMFLLEYTPCVLDELLDGLELITVAAEYESLRELRAFDEVSVRMRMADVAPTQIRLDFDYVRVRHGEEMLAAIGRRLVGCMCGGTPVRVPAGLARALAGYPSSQPAPRGAVRLGTGGRA